MFGEYNLIMHFYYLLSSALLIMDLIFFIYVYLYIEPTDCTMV